MDTVSKLQDIALRLDHLENLGEWLEVALAQVDPSAAQTGSLITTLADDARYRILELVTELETQIHISHR